MDCFLNRHLKPLYSCSFHLVWILFQHALCNSLQRFTRDLNIIPTTLNMEKMVPIEQTTQHVSLIKAIPSIILHRHQKIIFVVQCPLLALSRQSEKKIIIFPSTEYKYWVLYKYKYWVQNSLVSGDANQWQLCQQWCTLHGTYQWQMGRAPCANSKCGDSERSKESSLGKIPHWNLKLMWYCDFRASV